MLNNYHLGVVRLAQTTERRRHPHHHHHHIIFTAPYIRFMYV